MSDLSQMEVKQLRNEVQLLRDELAIFKRKYEDIIYNLDDDNFSSTLLREKEGMKTSIEVNAEGIKTKVSNAEFESAKTQLADEITSKVNTLDGTLSATIEQTASSIRQEVKDANDDLSAEITQTASEIYSTVSSNYSSLSGSISSVRQTANSVSSRVSDLESFKTSTFTQSADGFLLDGEKSGFTGYVYLADNQGNRKFTMFYDDSQGYEQVIMHDCVVGTIPLVLGDDCEDVYLGWYANGNQVATRRWVQENGGGGGSATAVFG